MNQEGDGFWGALSIQMLQSLKIDKAFLGVVGVDAMNGKLSTYDINDGFMKRQVIEQSQTNYLLCEEKKFYEYGNYIFASLNDVNGLIVSKEIDHELKTSLQQYTITII